jgi:hypothetical protein
LSVIASAEESACVASRRGPGLAHGKGLRPDADDGTRELSPFAEIIAASAILDFGDFPIDVLMTLGGRADTKAREFPGGL